MSISFFEANKVIKTELVERLARSWDLVPLVKPDAQLVTSEQVKVIKLYSM